MIINCFTTLIPIKLYALNIYFQQFILYICLLQTFYLHNGVEPASITSVIESEPFFVKTTSHKSWYIYWYGIWILYRIHHSLLFKYTKSTQYTRGGAYPRLQAMGNVDMGVSTVYGIATPVLFRCTKQHKRS